MNGRRDTRPSKPLRAAAMAALLTGAVLAVIHNALPAFWGSPNVAMKWDALHRAPRPARLLVGSSRIYRQVIPSLMDSVIGDGEHTFNAGFAATFPPATYQLCERLLNGPGPLPAVVLVELSNYMLYEEANLADHRYWYYLGPREGVGLVRHALWLPGSSRGERLAYAARAARATSYSLLGLGLVDHVMGSASDADTLIALGSSGDGALTLEEQVRCVPGDTGLATQRKAFLADTLAAGRRATGIRRLYDRGPDTPVSPVHLGRLNALLDKARQRGVRLCFVLPPLWLDRGEDLLALAHALPDTAVIALCHPDTFPAFYRPDYMFDAGHLNDQGARLFTIALARALRGEPTGQDLPH